MSCRSLLVGSRLPDLERAAFERVADAGGTAPARVLYLTGGGHPTEQSRRRWREFGSPLDLRIQSLERFVGECYERDQYDGEETHVDRSLLLRLVELGLEHLPDDNPFAAAGRLRSSGVTRTAEELFTDLEFAGLLGGDAVHDALADAGLDGRADAVAALARAVLDVREETLADTLPETFQTERIAHVAAETELAAQFPSVEAVVVGPLDQYDEVYVDLLEAVAEAWPTVAVCRRHTDTPLGTLPPGVDRGLDRALSAYDRLGFRQERVGPTPPFVASLYRHPETAPTVSTPDPSASGIELHEATDVAAELRYVARDVRERIAAGTDPAAIGVVVPTGSEHGERLDELFAQYDIPHHRRENCPLTETYCGALVGALCELAAEPRRAETVLRVVTNPLVDTDGDYTTGTGVERIDRESFARTADRVTATDLRSVVSHVDPETADGVRSLLSRAERLAEVSLDALPETVDETLADLGVDRIDGSPEAEGAETATRLGGVDRDRERRARQSLTEVVASLSTTAAAADETLGTTAERLSRALDGVSVPDTVGDRDGAVRVRRLGDAAAFEFSHTYLLGLTTAHLPGSHERTTLVAPIYDRLPTLAAPTPRAETRANLAGHLAGDGSVTLSVPRHDADGERLVEADLLTELRRLLDLDTAAVDPDEPRPGSVEDVHREIGRAVAASPPRADTIATGVVDGGDADAVDDDVVSAAVATGAISETHADRLRAGVACANARSDAALTPYDGQLTPETVELLHPPERREPYSPSRVEQYAGCGFEYYADRVLGIEAPDRIERDPDAAARGTFVHEVLAAYYRSSQTERGEPVDPTGDRETRGDRLLSIALDRLDAAFGSETTFQTVWLREVLAGLGTPAENPYYWPSAEPSAGGDATPADHDEPEVADRPRGLFARFLATEADQIGKTTARPAWFEASVGRPDDGGTHLGDGAVTVGTPAGPVPVGGIVDRVDTVRGEPTEFVVRDYKTGSTPGEADTLGGLNFQLPLYATLVEAALDGETAGGAYYRVSPPAGVSPHSGTVSSQERTAWAGYDDPGTPLLRWQRPQFETHTAFRQFVDETVPERLGQVVGGIEAGRFHPTVLDPDDAGCEYCDYRTVCDVRPHRRRDVIDRVDDDETTYVPAAARDDDLADVVGVN